MMRQTQPGKPRFPASCVSINDDDDDMSQHEDLRLSSPSQDSRTPSCLQYVVRMRMITTRKAVQNTVRKSVGLRKERGNIGYLEAGPVILTYQIQHLYEQNFVQHRSANSDADGRSMPRKANCYWPGEETLFLWYVFRPSISILKLSQFNLFHCDLVTSHRWDIRPAMKQSTSQVQSRAGHDVRAPKKSFVLSQSTAEQSLSPTRYYST